MLASAHHSANRAARNDVALVTCSQFPELSRDDGALLAALTRRQVRARPAVWDDRGVEWSSTRLCVIRSTWDYTTRREEFLAWAETVSGEAQLWNPVEVLRWNTHKTYLRDLAFQGISIVPTVWLAAGSRVNLGPLLAEQGWPEAVVKPAVSASARETIRVSSQTLKAGQVHLDRLLSAEDVVVQLYLASVETAGELSVMFIDNEFTHAVRKRPARGDFRVQEEFGGSDERVTPTEGELELAGAALRAAGRATLYARADLVHGDGGALHLAELELVEPELFLRHAPEAAERLADAICARLVHPST